MDQKIKELTEKIYQEGIVKGEQKAGEIIRSVEARSTEIIADAQKQAGKIIADARQQADEFRRNTEADLRLSASQAMSALKQQILNALMVAVVDKPVSAALADPATMKEFLKIAIQNWNTGGGGSLSLDVLLPEARRAELESALTSALQHELSRGLTLRFSKAIRAGFQIQPRGGSFKISLTDEDFQEFFKEYLRPKTKTFLFGT
jgi:V/A-type H+-transporting ATPase subunit E